MKSSSILTAFYFAFSFLLAKPCVSDGHQVINHEDYSAVYDSKLTLPLLSRKLKLHEETTVKHQDFIPLKKETIQASSGTGNNKQDEKEENEMHAAAAETGKGTYYKEWIESPNKSEYFTMDYAWVRRRRPIHNKQFPNFVP